MVNTMNMTTQARIVVLSAMRSEARRTTLPAPILLTLVI